MLNKSCKNCIYKRCSSKNSTMSLISLARGGNGTCKRYSK